MGEFDKGRVMLNGSHVGVDNVKTLPKSKVGVLVVAVQSHLSYQNNLN